MVRKCHSFVLVVLILAIVSLAIPESRRVMALQFGYLAYGRVYPDVDALENGWSNLYRLAAQSTDVKLPSEWETWVARAEFGSRAERSERAVKAAPDRPEVYASAMVAHCTKTHWTLGQVTTPYHHVSDNEMDAKTGVALLSLSQQGARLDPNNAYFGLISAYALFGLHRDAEALQVFHSAAQKKRFDAYRHVAVKAAMQYLNAAGMPRTEICTFYYPVLYPDQSRIRQTVSMLVDNARLLASEDKYNEAEGLLMDVINVGMLMRQSDQTVDRKWGMAIQTKVTAFAGKLGSSHLGPASMDHRVVDVWQAETTAALFTAHGWDELTKLWCQESATGFDFSRRHEEPTREELTLILAVAFTRLSSSALLITLVLAVIWLVLFAIIKQQRVRTEWAPPGRAWRVHLLIWCLVPWGALTIVHSPHSFPCPGLSAMGMGWPEPVRAKAVLLLLCFVFIGSVALGFTASRMRHTARWRAWLAGMLILGGIFILCRRIDWYDIHDIYEGLSNPHMLLSLIVLAFVTVRTIFLRHSRPHQTNGMTAVETAYVASAALARAFVLIYFVVLLGHLALRYQVINDLRSVVTYEVGWRMPQGK